MMDNGWYKIIYKYINILISNVIDTLIKIWVMKEDKYDITIMKNDIATRWCPLVICRLIARIN